MPTPDHPASLDEMRTERHEMAFRFLISLPPVLIGLAGWLALRKQVKNMEQAIEDKLELEAKEAAAEAVIDVDSRPTERETVPDGR